MKTLNLDSLEITHLQHASFKIKTPDQMIYLDPFKVSAGEPADLILITHEHFDHFDPASIKKISDPETIIVLPVYLSDKISGNIKPIKIGETIKIAGLEITALPAYNLTKSFHPKDRGDLSYLIELDGKRIFFSGDSDNVPEWKNLKNIDVAMLPIGGTYTMDEEEAAEAVKKIQPKMVMPMHYGPIPGGGDAEKFKGLVGGSTQVQILG